jgi:hypothetical protein
MVPVLPPPCRTANRRLRVSLRVEHWPAADLAAWRALFTTGDVFDESGPGAHLASRSRTSLENTYGRWLGFVARAEPNGLDEALEDRVTRERIMAFAQHLAETNLARTVAGQLRSLRGALRLWPPIRTGRGCSPSRSGSRRARSGARNAIACAPATSCSRWVSS